MVVVLGVLGCGRLGFSPPPPAGDAADASPIDGPPIPTAICKVDRIAQAGLPATADLAITGTAEGYAAVWVDPTGAVPAHGAILAPDHELTASRALPDLADPRLGGITDVGQKLVLSTGNATSQTTWILARDLTTASSELTLGNSVMPHGPYPTDTLASRRVFVAATASQVTAAYIADDGLINQASTTSHTTTAKVTDVACADGPDHSHCAFAEAVVTVNGASRCTATDVQLAPVPNVTGGPVVSPDCYDVRTSSGPDLADSMIAVWTTADHRVESRYVGASGVDLARSIGPAGSAPKVQFDGTRFWIAWLDGGGALQLSSFDLNGRIVPYSLAGWVPIGPEAFELVRRGSATAVALLSAAGLDVLTICP